MRWIALLCGSLFGLGLALSGMLDPAKVQGFLDISGQWDPSLALVMSSALAVFMPGYLGWVKPRRQSLDGSAFHLSTKQQLEPSLLLGAGLFGIGWGLVGVCPGPAVAMLVTGQASVFWFVAALLLGIKLVCLWQDWQQRQGLAQGS